MHHRHMTGRTRTRSRTGRSSTRRPACRCIPSDTPLGLRNRTSRFGTERRPDKQHHTRRSSGCQWQHRCRNQNRPGAHHRNRRCHWRMELQTGTYCRILRNSGDRLRLRRTVRRMRARPLRSHMSRRRIERREDTDAHIHHNWRGHPTDLYIGRNRPVARRGKHIRHLSSRRRMGRCCHTTRNSSDRLIDRGKGHCSTRSPSDSKTRPVRSGRKGSLRNSPKVSKERGSRMSVGTSARPAGEYGVTATTLAVAYPRTLLAQHERTTTQPAS